MDLELKILPFPFVKRISKLLLQDSYNWTIRTIHLKKLNFLPTFQ